MQGEYLGRCHGCWRCKSKTHRGVGLCVLNALYIGWVQSPTNNHTTPELFPIHGEHAGYSAAHCSHYRWIIDSLPRLVWSQTNLVQIYLACTVDPQARNLDDNINRNGASTPQSTIWLIMGVVAKATLVCKMHTEHSTRNPNNLTVLPSTLLGFSDYRIQKLMPKTRSYTPW